MNNEGIKLVRFDHFMKHALHNPDSGYYAKNIRTVGSRGDFSTTATLSNVLGKAIAKSAVDWSHTNKSPLNLIEVGGGDGSLAESIFQSIPILKRWRLHYHIVDNSNPLSVNQQQRKYSKKIIWHSDMKAALNSCKGVAFIFSNELVDAFPVRIFKKSNKHWNELYLHNQEEHFCPCAGNFPNSSAIFYTDHKNGQRVEVHESYREWMHEWLPSWKRGQLLTIDYGDTHPQIYYRKPDGTLRAYFNHQKIAGNAVYQNPGKLDITTDINFTDLIDWGKHDGLETNYFISQRNFLMPHVSNKAEDQFLIHPDGAGSAFKVLLQQRTL
jgi:SAM-dependent MidA family methyltransferase